MHIQSCRELQAGNDKLFSVLCQVSPFALIAEALVFGWATIYCTTAHIALVSLGVVCGRQDILLSSGVGVFAGLIPLFATRRQVVFFMGIASVKTCTIAIF